MLVKSGIASVLPQHYSALRLELATNDLQMLKEIRVHHGRGSTSTDILLAEPWLEILAALWHIEIYVLAPNLGIAWLVSLLAPCTSL